MKITLVAAIAKNNIIGINNSLPWNIPEDLKKFKAMTSGHPILMGRKTFESIGRPLPNRKNIVLTSDEKYFFKGIDITNSFVEAINLIKELNEEIFIIGGSSIYKLFESSASQLAITHIEKEFEGDSYFPAFNWSRWEIKSEEKFFDEKSQINCRLTIYQRKV